MTHLDSPVADHGGNLDSARKQHGGRRVDWIDLSTGINPVPYPLPPLDADLWCALPDQGAENDVIRAARDFWSIPEHLQILPTNGASAIITAAPFLFDGHRVDIPGPTYNEHQRAFMAAGWTIASTEPYDMRVLVHPNNPDGRLWSQNDLEQPNLILDESFADCSAEISLLPHLSSDNHLVLKSFGKFWGLAGLRLGFAIGAPQKIARLRQMLGPWPVSGPALFIGAAALRDENWARATRWRLAEDAQRLDALATAYGWRVVGGTSLFRLYDCPDARAAQTHLATQKIWSRTFPYSATWLRLGLPAPQDWPRVEAALAI